MRNVSISRPRKETGICRLKERGGKASSGQGHPHSFPVGLRLDFSLKNLSFFESSLLFCAEEERTVVPSGYLVAFLRPPIEKVGLDYFSR